MRRVLFTIAAIVAIALAGAAPATAVGDNGTGVFWLTSGSGGTGEARNFNIGPDHTENLTALRYNSNCSGTCDFIANTASSIIFSCGSLGTPIDDSDTVTFYDIYPNVGAHVTVNPSYPAQCSNGRIIVSLSIFGFSDKADSIITNE